MNTNDKEKRNDTKNSNAADTKQSANASAAEKHAANGDLLDELIDISEALGDVVHPLTHITDTLVASVADATGAAQTAPAAHQPQHILSFSPRTQASRCTNVKQHTSIDETAQTPLCSLCLEACPTGCISIEGAMLTIDEDRCIGCGICQSVCPSESFLPKDTGEGALDFTTLYKKVMRASLSYERAYITCLPAAEHLGLLDILNNLKNVVIVPCLAAIPAELWFALLTDTSNVDVLLPPFLCDSCLVNAEKLYAQAISTAETWSQKSLGLIGKRDEINPHHRRQAKRGHFMDAVSRAPEALLSGSGPLSYEQHVEAAVQEYMERLDAFKKVVQEKRSLAVPPHAIPTDFNKTEVGAKKSIHAPQLTKKQLFLLASIAAHPQDTPSITLKIPERNQSLCTSCGACEQVCPTNAVQFRQDDTFQTTKESCVAHVGCSACQTVCPAHAIHYEENTADEYLF